MVAQLHSQIRQLQHDREEFYNQSQELQVRRHAGIPEGHTHRVLFSTGEPFPDTVAGAGPFDLGRGPSALSVTHLSWLRSQTEKFCFSGRSEQLSAACPDNLGAV